LKEVFPPQLSGYKNHILRRWLVEQNKGGIDSRLAGEAGLPATHPRRVGAGCFALCFGTNDMLV